MDNFSTGRREFLAGAVEQPGFTLVEHDLVEGGDQLEAAIDGSDAVVHLAANADVRFGWNDTRRDLEQNVVATLNVLEAHAGDRGPTHPLLVARAPCTANAHVIPTPEDAPFPVQTSLYGASKAAAEGYSRRVRRGGAGLGHRVPVRVDPRTPLHPRPRHRLRRPAAEDPTTLPRPRRRHPAQVLPRRRGLCRGRDVPTRPSDRRSRCSTSASTTTARSRDSIGWITERLGLEPELDFGGGDRGWVGDNPFIFLDTSRIRADRLGSEFTHPGGRRAHRRLPDGQRVALDDAHADGTAIPAVRAADGLASTPDAPGSTR